MKYIRYKWPFERINLYPLVCWHVGAKQSRQDFIEKVITKIEDDPYAKWIYMGDAGECVTKTSKGNIYEQLLSPGDQLRIAAGLLSRINEKGLFGIRGNHGNRIDRDSGIGWDEMLCERIGIPYAGVAAMLDLGIGKTNISVYVHHGSSNGISPAGKMSGAHRAEQFIASDIILTAHCFDQETELLTDNGWKKRENLNVGDKVVTLNNVTHGFEYNNIQKLFDYSNFKELHQIRGRNVDLAVTNEHGLIDASNLELEYYTAQEFSNKCQRTFICAGVLHRDTIHYTDNELKLIVWTTADGSFNSPKHVRFHLKKPRKIARLESLLQVMGIEYTKRNTLANTVDIRFYLPENIQELFNFKAKTLPQIMGQASQRQAMVILTEYGQTDGYKSSENTYQISTAKEAEADLLQALFVTSGFRCNKTKGSTTFTLAVNPTSTTSEIPTKGHLLIIPNTGSVWCATVENGTLLIRRGGKVCITQNTHACGEAWPTRYMAVVNRRNKCVDWNQTHSFVCGSAYDSRSGYAEEKMYPPLVPEHLVISISEKGDGDYEVTHSKILL